MGERPLSDILYSQGFGTRAECAALVASGVVTVGGEVQHDATAQLPTAGLSLVIAGVAWPFREKALVMLHKPAGFECSRQPVHHPSVLSLLPMPLRRRGVQPVGRLDADTTGLLLLTDDGALIHRLTSPRRHEPKVYEVTTRHAVTGTQVTALLEGVVLDDDPRPVRAAAAASVGDHGLRMTLTEGRYHQVKRMLAAVGNRVEALHRSAFGRWVLPADLAPGAWRWVD